MSDARFTICWLTLATLALAAVPAGAAESLTMTLPPAKVDRRFVLAERVIPADRLKPPFALRAADDRRAVPVQWEPSGDGNIVRFIIPLIPANRSVSLVLEHGDADVPARMTVTEKDGLLSVADRGSEITRYNFGPQFEKFKKPFFWPVNVAGVNPVRDWPMSDARPNEPHDHPHHTGVYFAYGEVNGKEYWSKLPITHVDFAARVSGPVYARVEANNRWGEDLLENQNILILAGGPDAVVMDWTITLSPPSGRGVEFGKTKEGGFSVRVTDGISFKDEKANGDANMLDAEGHRGEKAIRNEKGTGLDRPQSAPWADDTGTVDGKTVGVTIMNHPTSWRYPTDWHVRAYGLFTASPFFLRGGHTLKPGESLTLKYRLYFHAGGPDEAHVADVFAGYTNNKVELP